MCATCNVLRSLLIDRGMSPALAMSITAQEGPVAMAEEATIGQAKKAKRKVSKYARAYGAAYKALKRKALTLENRASSLSRTNEHSLTVAALMP